MSNKARILLIGPLINAEQTNIGGATRSFALIIRYFEEQQIPHTVVDTQAGGGKLGKFSHVRKAIKAQAQNHDILFLNSSQNGIRTLGPMVCWLGRKHKLKVAIRPFGSAFKELYENATVLTHSLLKRTVLKADLLYLQTEALLSHFEPLARNAQQLPTSRFSPPTEALRGSKPYQKRFVFIGQLTAQKGALTLLRALHELSNDYTVHLYGPLRDDISKAAFKDSPHYKGVLKDEAAVWQTLASYDVVVLPTSYPGEGYAGIIIEAYAMGLPVITSNWMALPEILQEGKTGFLLHPAHPTAVKLLAEAMQRFTAENYPAMSRNARAYFEQRFEANAVMQRMVEQLNALT